MAQVEGIVLADSSVAAAVVLVGLDLLTFSQQTNSATMFVRVKPWDERKRKDQALDAIVARVNGQLFGLKKAVSFGFNFPEIPGLGRTSGLEMNLQARAGGDYRTFAGIANAFVADANALPECGRHRAHRADVPQLLVKVDQTPRLRAGRSGTDLLDPPGASCPICTSTTSTFTAGPTGAGRSAPESGRRRGHRLVLRAELPREMVPLGALVTTEMRGGPSIVQRFNGFPRRWSPRSRGRARARGSLIAAVERLGGRQVRRPGHRLRLRGQTYQERISGRQRLAVHRLGLIMVFLVLAAQYESLAIPFARAVGVPFGVFGALLGPWLRGMPSDGYFPVGMIAVIGLAARTRF